MKRKILMIFGIILCVGGLCVFAYPLVSQAYSAYKQKQMMKEINAQILANLTEINNNTGTAGKTENKQTDDTADAAPAQPQYSADVPDFSGLDLFEDEYNNGDIPEDEGDTLAQSRLSGQKCLGIITCEKIDLVYAIVEGVENWNIGVAIGHFPDSVAIGAEGNCALAGHRGGTHGKYFGAIRELEEGDEVVLTNLKGEEYTYVVYEHFIVEPTQVEVVKDLGMPGKYLTMVTCTNDGTQRHICRAKCTSDPVLVKDDTRR